MTRQNTQPDPAICITELFHFLYLDQITTGIITPPTTGIGAL